MRRTAVVHLLVGLSFRSFDLVSCLSTNARSCVTGQRTTLLLAEKQDPLEEQILELAKAPQIDYKELEAQVLASAQAQLDYNHLVNLLSSPSDGKLEKYFLSSKINSFTSNWNVSLAASVVFSLLAYLLFSNIFVSTCCFIGVFFVANTDPVADDNILGAVARMVGRETLKAFQLTVKPKASAMARAALTGEAEVSSLQNRIKALELENAQLVKWKQHRIQAEENMSTYNLADLKDMARENDLPVGGTKLQLMVRLMEKDLLVIPENK